jgi:hypothetical protein
MRAGLAALCAVVGLGCAAASAQAQETLRLVYREEFDPRGFEYRDNDRSGSQSVGDEVRIRLNLMKGNRREAVVRIVNRITAVQGAQLTLHEESVVTFQRRGNRRGGHLYTARDHTEDMNDLPNVGQTEVIPVVRGDGRFAGYTGEVHSTIVRVNSRTLEETSRSTIVLRRTGA